MMRRINYENLIKHHQNYAFIPQEYKAKWVSISKNGVNLRKSFWDNLQNDLVSSGKLAKGTTLSNVARYIHPTKKHVCKKCDTECSIYYEYPTSNTWKWLQKNFQIERDQSTIFEIYSKIETNTKQELFTKYFEKPINELETLCKSDQYLGKKLSPGVMSNPPDRLDGFHCYNSICDCRSKHDKGRSDENMKSYTRDRRAYELYSDGNCLLANCVMGHLNTIKSVCFICGKPDQIMTADHIGPISLGFIHDPLNFQACCSSCNSSKSNRLTQRDVDNIKAKDTPMLSWWANDVWEKFKHTDNLTIKKNLDQNSKKFISVIDWLKCNKMDVLKKFVTESYMNHAKSYKISSMEVLENGVIKFTHEERDSERKTKTKQYERTIEVLLEETKKTNRKVKIGLSEKEVKQLLDIDTSNFKSKILEVL